MDCKVGLLQERKWRGLCTSLGIKRGDTMEWVNFKVKDGEREKLKNDAYAHRMNISEYLRWLIDKQRKGDERK